MGGDAAADVAGEGADALEVAVVGGVMPRKA